MAGRSTYATCGAILALIAAGAVAPARAEPAADAKGSPIEFIVPFGPGGGADQLARRIAPRLSEVLGTEVAVTNIPGATGNVGMAKLLNAPADGRKIAVLTGDTLAWLAHLNAGWTPADVVPIAVMMRESSMLFLPTDSRFKSWRELENEARQKPHSLRVAISGLGIPDYIALQQLDAAGIRLLALPFSNPEERYAAGDHPTLSTPGQGLPAWTRANRSI